MSAIHNRLANILTIVGGIAAFTAVMPSFEYHGGTVVDTAMVKHLQAHPDHLPYKEAYRFGWTFSPLVEHLHARELDVKADSGFTLKHSSNTRFDLISWSALSLGVGVVLIALARKVRAKSSVQVS